MLLHRRKHGSQRRMAPIKLEVMPNASGDPDITFKGGDGIWYVLTPESHAEMKLLLSEAHIVHHNWPDECAP